MSAFTAIGPRLCCSLLLSLAAPLPRADIDPGAALYGKHCARCHELPQMAHITEQVRAKSPGFTEAALDRGVMRTFGANLTRKQREQVAAYLGQAPPAAGGVSPACTFAVGEGTAGRASFPDWGNGLNNHRAVSGDTAIDRETVRDLTVRWVVAFPDATNVRSPPTAALGALFAGSHNGTVYALDQATGCTHWRYRADAEVRTAITLVTDADGARAYFADRAAKVYAVDAKNGALLWKRGIDPHPGAAVTGSITAHDGKLLAPVSTVEDSFASDPHFACCTHRGALVALARDSGKLLWRTHPVAETPEIVGKNSLGTPIWAPSGASIWNTPTVDTERNRVYVGTGNNHTAPAGGHSDSVLAIDLDGGDILWAYQGQAGDAWNFSCSEGMPTPQNCPADSGPDSDFGTSPMLISRAGGDVLVAGQKSGVVHALDPETGRLLWKKRLARGGWIDGIHFGMAYYADTLYIPSSDTGRYRREGMEATPGLFALDAEDGGLLWSHSHSELCGAAENCEAGISAPPLVTPELVFVATLQGAVHAFDGNTGERLWRFDSGAEFTALNGEKTRGGGIAGAAGPMLVNDRLFISSGYGSYGRPGNALIALGLR